ncbi:DUF3575 domain-containing protein [Prevotella sp. 10(H)]|uniref:DUF3575 domain-containing protein n=1 Tax=Prevotella sp. 10(H) TaxID=1158294 RepID=UPI0004A700BE|nr:DUF3575 domain-containing protein [Prevotella sp. 10(H)]
MIKRLLFTCIVLAFVSVLHAQEERKHPYLPTFALKTNALYWATTTPNLGFEIGLSEKFTLDISGNYNPWTFSDNKKLKHWLVQPELRYWTCERFNGHFFGLHGHYAEYNVGGIKQLGLSHRRYEGNLWGAGISYGYHWILGNHWSIEATIGVGYAHLDYDKYGCGHCAAKIKDDTKNYWGPTKAGLSIIYVIK